MVCLPGNVLLELSPETRASLKKNSEFSFLYCNWVLIDHEPLSGVSVERTETLFVGRAVHAAGFPPEAVETGTKTATPVAEAVVAALGVPERRKEGGINLY